MKAEEIRPESVLKTWFKMLMNKQKRLGLKNYNYCCDQLKAIRQDLTFDIVYCFKMCIFF